MEDILTQAAVPTLEQWGQVWTKTKKTVIPNDKIIEPGDFKEDEEESWKSNEPGVPTQEFSLQDVLNKNDENFIINFAKQKRRFKANELIDIWNKAKELKSNKLINLVKQLTPLSESLSFKNYLKIING